MFKKLYAIFARLSKRERMILGGSMIFISLAAVDRLILGPIILKTKSLHQEIQGQKDTIRKSLHILAQKDRITKEITHYNSYVTSVRSEEEEAVFLLQDLEEMANKSSVYVIDIKTAGLKTADIFKKFLVRLNIEAQMEQLMDFFYSIENSKKLLKIEKYDLKPKTEGSSILRCSMTISKAVLP